MSALNRKDEFTEPVLTDTPAWWASMDVPGVNVVRKGMTSITEAFEQYLPWTVRKVRLYDANPLGESDDMIAYMPTEVFVTKRSDTGTILSGGLSDVYTPVQPIEVAELMERGLSDVDYKVASAGSLVQGRTMFASVRLDEVGEMNVYGQKLQPLLAVVNSFDGSGALKVVNTVIRPECLNTIDAALFSGEKVGTLKHTTNVGTRIPFLQNSIRTYITVMDDFQREVAEMIETEVTPKQSKAVISKMSPIPEPTWANGVVSNKAAITRAEGRRETLTDLYENDPRVGFVGTKWGLVQMASTFRQNHIGLRKTESGPQSKAERKLVRLFEGKVAEDDRKDLLTINRVLADA